MSSLVEVRLTGVDETLNTLNEFAKEMGKRGGPVRAGLRKGAVYIQKGELANLDAAVANSDDEGKRRSTGFLRKNVVVTRRKPPAGVKGEAFAVRVRRKAYPDRTGATTSKAAALLEYGSSQQPAEPWIRPAFTARAREAINLITQEINKAVERCKKKLAKG